jgi:hypothetical protein
MLAAQRRTLIGAETIAAVHSQCLLWVDFVVKVGDYLSAMPTATFWDGCLRPAPLRVAALMQLH